MVTRGISPSFFQVFGACSLVFLRCSSFCNLALIFSGFSGYCLVSHSGCSHQLGTFIRFVNFFQVFGACSLVFLRCSSFCNLALIFSGFSGCCLLLVYNNQV